MVLTQKVVSAVLAGLAHGKPCATAADYTPDAQWVEGEETKTCSEEAAWLPADFTANAEKCGEMAGYPDGQGGTTPLPYKWNAVYFGAALHCCSGKADKCSAHRNNYCAVSSDIEPEKTFLEVLEDGKTVTKSCMEATVDFWEFTPSEAKCNEKFSYEHEGKVVESRYTFGQIAIVYTFGQGCCGAGAPVCWEYMNTVCADSSDFSPQTTTRTDTTYTDCSQSIMFFSQFVPSKETCTIPPEQSLYTPGFYAVHYANKGCCGAGKDVCSQYVPVLNPCQNECDYEPDAVVHLSDETATCATFVRMLLDQRTTWSMDADSCVAGAHRILGNYNVSEKCCGAPAKTKCDEGTFVPCTNNSSHNAEDANNSSHDANNSSHDDADWPIVPIVVGGAVVVGGGGLLIGIVVFAYKKGMIATAAPAAAPVLGNTQDFGNAQSSVPGCDTELGDLAVDAGDGHHQPDHEDGEDAPDAPDSAEDAQYGVAWPCGLGAGNARWCEGFYRVSDFFDPQTHRAVADTFQESIQQRRGAPQRDVDAADIDSFCGDNGFDFSSGMNLTVRAACDQAHPGRLQKSPTDATRLLDEEIIRVSPKQFCHHSCDLATAKNLQTFLHRMLSGQVGHHRRSRVRPLYFPLARRAQSLPPQSRVSDASI